MKTKFKLNSAGISIVEVLIGLVMMAFFMSLVQENFRQTDHLYKRATVRTDLDRMKQHLHGALKNPSRIKKALQNTLGAAKFDELLNCFGQRGLNQPAPPAARVPGVNCNTKFPSPNNAWSILTEPSGENLFNQFWSMNGKCDPTVSQCLLEAKTQYFISCTQVKCYAVHIKSTISPTAIMLSKKDELMKHYSSDDFKVKEFETTVPTTAFGIENQIQNETCNSFKYFMRNLDFEYQRLMCNDDFLSNSQCDIALRSINGPSSCDPSTIVYNESKTDGVILPSEVDVTQNNSNVQIKLTAKPSLNAGTRRRPNPTDPTQMITEPEPFINTAKGDTVRINCGLPLASYQVLSPTYETTIQVNLSSQTANSDITCLFYVATSTGSSKGNVGRATIHFYNSVTREGVVTTGGTLIPGGGGTGSTPPPPSVDSSQL